jgi:hypothetical protein
MAILLRSEKLAELDIVVISKAQTKTTKKFTERH